MSNQHQFSVMSERCQTLIMHGDDGCADIDGGCDINDDDKEGEDDDDELDDGDDDRRSTPPEVRGQCLTARSKQSLG
eukprot:469781-Rhodomonas_salina.1